jgi:hypothetical protein
MDVNGTLARARARAEIRKRDDETTSDRVVARAA